MNWLFKKFLIWLGKRLDGYKTLIGTWSLKLLGVLGIVSTMFPDIGLPQVDVETSLTMIAGGAAGTGVAYKMDKIKDELQKQTDMLRRHTAGPTEAADQTASANTDLIGADACGPG